MVGVDARRSERQHAVGDAPVGVGEQRVVADACGERALGHAAQEHAVEVEAEAECDVTHEDAVAQSTDAAEVVVELEGEGAAEHVEPGWALDRVEAGEPFERRIDLVGGLLLRFGPVASTLPSRSGTEPASRSGTEPAT